MPPVSGKVLARELGPLFIWTSFTLKTRHIYATFVQPDEQDRVHAAYLVMSIDLATNVLAIQCSVIHGVDPLHRRTTDATFERISAVA